MDENERRFLLDMRANLEKYIQLINDQLITYKPEDDDEKHEFLVKKAIWFRDALKKVNDQLNQNDNL